MNVDKMIGTWSDYDPWQRLWPGIDEKGFAMAVIKKLCGNESALFHKLFKTWVLESKDAPKESIPPFNIIIDGIDPAKQLKDMINRIFAVGGSDEN